MGKRGGHYTKAREKGPVLKAPTHTWGAVITPGLDRKALSCIHTPPRTLTRAEEGVITLGLGQASNLRAPTRETLGLGGRRNHAPSLRASGRAGAASGYRGAATCAATAPPLARREAALIRAASAPARRCAPRSL